MACPIWVDPAAVQASRNVAIVSRPGIWGVRARVPAEKTRSEQCPQLGPHQRNLCVRVEVLQGGLVARLISVDAPVVRFVDLRSPGVLPLSQAHKTGSLQMRRLQARRMGNISRWAKTNPVAFRKGPKKGRSEPSLKLLLHFFFFSNLFPPPAAERLGCLYGKVVAPLLGLKQNYVITTDCFEGLYETRAVYALDSNDLGYVGAVRFLVLHPECMGRCSNPGAHDSRANPTCLCAQACCTS